MAEKKIVTLGIRLDETMLLKIKGLAEVDGVTESEFARTAISRLVEEREALYHRLHSIFGHGGAASKVISVQHGTTGHDLQEMSYEVSE